MRINHKKRINWMVCVLFLDIYCANHSMKEKEVLEGEDCVSVFFLYGEAADET